MTRNLSKKERLAIPRHPMPARSPVERIRDFDEVAEGYTEVSPGIYGLDAAVYLQNDDASPGFNPNDEHALKLGDTVYALRDDLGTPGTSEPWVLLQYREQSGPGLWRFRLMQVVAEEDPWFLHEWGPGFDLLSDPYKWEAGIPTSSAAG